MPNYPIIIYLGMLRNIFLLSIFMYDAKRKGSLIIFTSFVYSHFLFKHIIFDFFP